MYALACIVALRSADASPLADKTYFLYMAFNIAAAIHIVRSILISRLDDLADLFGRPWQFFMFPETKGRTLEEMEEVFTSGNAFAAWRIPPTVGKQTLGDLEACVLVSSPIAASLPDSSGTFRSTSSDHGEKDIKRELSHDEEVKQSPPV